MRAEPRHAEGFYLEDRGGAKLLVRPELREALREAELHRLKGEALSREGDEVEAEACFRRAIHVARHQQARSWELRAAVSLCRLWRAQGTQRKRQEARQLLGPIYGWFSEGFDTPDLREAKALLDALAKAGGPPSS